MKNLSAEMARFNVTVHDIGKAIGCSDRTIRNKMSGVSEFNFSEALKIRDCFFPEMTLEYLFYADVNSGKAG